MSAISEGPEPIHTWFNLTYANYLVLPRAILQSMPEDWQRRFVRCLEDLERQYGELEWPHAYRVNAVDSRGKYVKDPIPHYDRGRTRVEPSTSST